MMANSYTSNARSVNADALRQPQRFSLGLAKHGADTESYGCIVTRPKPRQ